MDGELTYSGTERVIRMYNFSDKLKGLKLLISANTSMHTIQPLINEIVEDAIELDLVEPDEKGGAQC